MSLNDGVVVFGGGHGVWVPSDDDDDDDDDFFNEKKKGSISFVPFHYKEGTRYDENNG